jgi:membrane protein YqaA with SNARE-associated domain
VQLRARLPVYWQRFGIALLGLAALGGAILAVWPDMAGVFLFALYSMPANSLLPVPHEPGLLYLAAYYDPAWLALAGCLGTAVAAATDYPVVKLAFKHPKIRRARDTRLYRQSVRWLMRWPFLTIMGFAFIPVPIYVVRVLAPASGYPLWRYIAATVVGRFPRYYAMAWLGQLFQIPSWILIGLFVVMVAMLVLGSRVADDIGIDGLEVLEASDTALPIVTEEVAALVEASHAGDATPPAVTALHADEKPG